VIGVLRPGLRVLAVGTAACALVAAVGTYARGSLVAIAGGMVVATALAFAVGGVSRRARAATVVATIGVLAVVGIAPRIAANASSTPAPAPPSGVPTPTLRERARGIVNPVSDVSVNDRLTTWRHLGREILHQPLGTGLGTVGHASPGAAGAQVTADNSYLKILREQGIPVGALFLVGVFGLCAVVARRLRRVDGESRILGLAALCGFLSFLFLSVAGEAVEQPGKAFAWTLLGVAVAQAWSGRRESRLSEVAVAREKAPNT
jgi:O-antigen ligase